jgi:hypothetical protein
MPWELDALRDPTSNPCRNTGIAIESVYGENVKDERQRDSGKNVGRSTKMLGGRESLECPGPEFGRQLE